MQNSGFFSVQHIAQSAELKYPFIITTPNAPNTLSWMPSKLDNSEKAKHAIIFKYLIMFV